MPYTPPIGIKELSKKGIFDEDRFFQLLSEQCNYTEKAVVKDFYMGFVRMLTQELRTTGIVRLPHLGFIALVKQKPTVGLSGKQRVRIDGKYMIKFYVKDTWRKYFTKLSEKSGKDGELDPREKILGKQLE